MKPVNQSILHDPENGKIGNCFQACVASIFELPIEEVPHFVKIWDSRWWLLFSEWLDDYGIEPVEITGDRYIPPGHYIASGPTNRGTLHCCIYHEGMLAHDPHPSKAGLLKVTMVIHLLVVDIYRVRKIRNQYKENHANEEATERNDSRA